MTHIVFWSVQKEEIIKGQQKELVRNSVEETLNNLLDQERPHETLQLSVLAYTKFLGGLGRSRLWMATL
jgi:hypothetical protein